MPRKLTQDEFLLRMSVIHPNLDFSSFTYGGREVKSTVRCPAHTPYEATPSTLLQGCGCPSCWSERRRTNYAMSFEEFHVKALEVHGDRYIYTPPDKWSGVTHPIYMKCPEHGPFRQKPSLHLEGQGCKSAAILLTG